MLEIVVLVLGLLCLFLLLLLFLQHKDVRCIRGQLTYTNREHNTFRFHSASTDPQMKALCEEMQRLREYYTQEGMKAMRIDHNFKHLMTNISHDTRIPLTSTNGYLQMLETAEGEEERQHCFQVIQAHMTYLQDLLEELFLYTRLSSTSIESHPEPIRIHDMLSEVLLHYYEDFKQQELQVQLEVGPMTMPTGDPICLKRMLHNLCASVLHHGFGTLIVSAEQTDGTCELVFESDLVDDADTKAIFEHFYTKDNGGSGRDTGLGLAIVRGLYGGMQNTVFAQKEAHRPATHTIFPLAWLLQNDNLHWVRTPAGITVMR